MSKRARLTTLKSRIQVQPGRLAVITPGSWRSSKTTTAERGYGGAWQRARLEHLRAHPLCVMCLAEVPPRVTAASTVDHSIAHRGDDALFWDRSKWQSLCTAHHSSEAQRRDHAAK